MGGYEVMEVWDIYNKDRTKTNRTILRSETLQDGEFHLVVHIWPINSKQEFLIQKRTDSLSWMPGLWATTGGSAISGEDSITAAIRETKEEIGLEILPEKIKCIFSETRKNDHTDVYLVFTNNPISEFSFDTNEVTRIEWASSSTILEMVKDNLFINYGDEYFRKLFSSRMDAK